MYNRVTVCIENSKKPAIYRPAEDLLVFTDLLLKIKGTFSKFHNFTLLFVTLFLTTKLRN